VPFLWRVGSMFAADVQHARLNEAGSAATRHREGLLDRGLLAE
jgi:hypothetical protein